MSMFGDAIIITAKICKDNENFKEGETLKDTALNFGDKIKITKKITDNTFYKVGDTVTLTKDRLYHKDLNTVIDRDGDLWGFVNNNAGLNVCLGRPGIDFEFEAKTGIFENAQVGDEVYGRLFGEATVINANSGHPVYSIIVKGTDGHNRAVTFDGRNCETDKEPTWFYRSGDNKYLTERPVRTVPAHLVPIDTKIECKSFVDKGWKKRHYADKPMRCWNNGFTSWSDSRVEVLWEKIRLGEPIEIDGIKYEAGCEIKPVK